jgi:type IV secretion system protein VirB9
VIHRVAKTFVLRRGQLVGCVENRGYAGSGNYRPSGTTDPGVVREVKP